MADKARQTIRAFVALDLDAPSRRRVARVADRLRMASGAPSATWVPATQMHVTLKFIAELPIDAVAPLGTALRPLIEGMSGLQPCPYRLEAFPTIEAARVVLVELEDGNGRLAKLARKVDELALKFGAPPKDRPFRPHVTLARLKRTYDSRRWIRAGLAALSGECEPAGVTLFRSELCSGGPKYTPLASVVFDAN